MSASLLYRGFWIRGCRYVKTAHQGGRMTFAIRQERKDLRCPVCESRRIVRWGFQSRCFRSLPIGCRPVQIRLNVQRVGCGNGGEIHLLLRRTAIEVIEGRPRPRSVVTSHKTSHLARGTIRQKSVDPLPWAISSPR